MIEDNIEQLRQNVSLALEDNSESAITRVIDGIGIAELANLLESLPSQQRDLIWPKINPTLLIIHLMI